MAEQLASPFYPHAEVVQHPALPFAAFATGI